MIEEEEIKEDRRAKSWEQHHGKAIENQDIIISVNKRKKRWMHNYKSKVQRKKKQRVKEEKKGHDDQKINLNLNATQTHQTKHMCSRPSCVIWSVTKSSNPILYTVINVISPKTFYAHCAQTHKQIIEWQHHTYRYAVKSSPRIVHMHSLIEGERQNVINGMMTRGNDKREKHFLA